MVPVRCVPPRYCWLALLLAFGCRPQAPASSVPTARPSADAAAPSTSEAPRPNGKTEPRNVILLLADGVPPEAWTLARWTKGSSLAVDEILTGAIHTHSADSIVTDSAPAATAYATGYKGAEKSIAIGASRTTVDGVTAPAELARRPLATLLEAAEYRGYATGLVATSHIQHATPAAFSAHVPDRELYEEIAEQQIHQNIDVVLGGGAKYLLPKSFAPGVRADGENLVDALRVQGYAVVSTGDELANAQAGKIWGMFAPTELAYECDRERFEPKQPSLAEMTRHAIARLASLDESRSRGFFLFVEGSKVDWAAHSNDPVGVVSELLAFDAAVAHALAFAREHAQTQVIVVSDHGTGGLTIGTRSDANYTQTSLASVVTPLRKARISAERLSQLVAKAESPEALTSILEREWGIADASKEELAELNQQKQSPQNLTTTLTGLMSTRARLGWTTGGHTGGNVPLFAFGPDHPRGLLDNTAICQGIAQFLGLSLPEVQAELFVDLAQSLASSGYVTAIDRSDPNNAKLKVSKGPRTAELFQAKNWLVVNGKRHEVRGVVTFGAEGNQVFGPKQVVTLLGRELP